MIISNINLIILIVVVLLIQISSSSCKKLRALCLHGYMSCGKFMKVQLNQLISQTNHLVDYYFVDAPHTIIQPSSSSSSSSSSLRKAPKCRWWYGHVINNRIIYDG